MQELITSKWLPFRLLAAIVFLILLPNAAIVAQCTLACNSSLQVTLDETGQALIDIAAIAPNAAANCPNNLTLELVTPQGISLNNPLTCDQAGTTVVARVRNMISGNYCSTNLSVRDLLPPVVHCQEHFVSCSADTDPAIFGYPDWSDNCTANCNGNYTEIVVAFNCTTVQNGIPVIRRIDRTWLVRDAYNNVSNCLERIWLERPDVSNVTFPPNLDGTNYSALTCEQDPLNLDITGRPLIDEALIANPGPCAIGIGYSDQKIPYCGPGGYVILRKWTVIGACSNNVASATQIIRVEDRKPPVITPPPAVTVNTSPFNCGASVTLATATATDNCSAVTITATWPFGSGFGPFSNVPPGTHKVTYTATDACGNTKTATATVKVVDNTPPQVLCVPSLQVSLSSGGNAAIAARMLDAGSADNCGGPLTIEIERDTGVYGPEILLTCADAGKTVPVSLRVTDMFGLANFCSATITVRDLLRPVIQCPAALTLTCLEDFKNTMRTGQATATDNCMVKSIGYQDAVSIGTCNLGSVARTWMAIDSAGNTRSCVQTITIAPVNTLQVTFPADITLSTCTDPTTLNPNTTGRPKTTGISCSTLSITFSDQTYNSAPPPACYRIERKWKVLDFCIYDINQPAAGGYWEDTQLINITDNQPPALSLPADMTISAAQMNCMAAVSLSDAIVTDCSGPVIIAHNSVYATTSGNNASGMYPVGVHLVTFTAADACGNTTRQTIKLTIADRTPPVVTCRNNGIVYIQANGTATAAVSAVLGSATDNCAPVNSLSFELVPDFFDCTQTGQITVTLLASDPTGNSTACQGKVLVVDTLFRCNVPSPISIAGQIRNYAGTPVNEIPVRLTAVGMSKITTCDTSGRYRFESIMVSDTCSLRPFNNNNWLNGVTTLDLALISRHILNLEPLNSPYKIIAADANRSGTITTLDIVAVRRLILGIQDSIPNSTSWRFVPADFVFSNLINPFATPFPEFIRLNSPDTNVVNRDFIGIKLGDLNGNADLVDPRAPTDTAFLTIQNQFFNAGTVIQVPLHLTDWQQTTGFQWELGIDTNILSLDSVLYGFPQVFHAAHCAHPVPGRLSVSWNPSLETTVAAGEPAPVVLQFSAKRKGALREGLYLTEQRLKAELYRESNTVPVRLQLEEVGQETKMAKKLWVQPNAPNPFSDFTLIPFSMVEPGTVQFTLTDQYGRVLQAEKNDFTAGQHHFRIDRTQLGAPGVYFYEICVGTEVFRAKMVAL